MTRLRKLKKARQVLQDAHDLIERDGYDINTYDGGAHSGARCFIGAVRTVAGAEPEPEEAPADGDGPELGVALDYLDRAVARVLTRERKDYAREEMTAARGARQAERYLRGRYVETYGFQLHDDQGLGEEEQRATALRVFRRALTRVHKDIEALVA